VRKSTSEAHEHSGYGRTSSAWLPRFLVVPTWNGTTLCRATMCSPGLSSSLHPCCGNNRKCGLWTGGWISATGCGEAPSEAHDISVPWPMELKLRELRPGVTPYGCPRGGPNSKKIGACISQSKLSKLFSRTVSTTRNKLCGVARSAWCIMRWCREGTRGTGQLQFPRDYTA
jgi:hypothetical protein